jgi:hypothetical protein
MPKRSNEFQKLIYLVRKNLAAGATVTESAMLPDLLTGRKREVDVCVEGTVGGDQVRVCIECRDSARRADVGWVDAMKAKHDRLPTHALILASRSGFTPEAHEVARRYKIEALSVQQVDDADFKTLLGAKSTLWSKTVAVTVQKVIVRVVSTATLAAENVVVKPDNLVYAHDGSELGPIAALVELLLKAPHTSRYIQSEGKEEHVWFELRWEPPSDVHGNPLYLKRLEPLVLREIEYVEIKGPCEIKIKEFGLRHADLGEVHLVWGTTQMFGKETLVVATRDQTGAEKVSINIAGPRPQPAKARPKKRVRRTSKKGSPGE